MKKWYNKYLSVFEKPFDTAPSQVLAEIKEKIAQKQSLEPLVTIAVIAHNEETRLLSCLWSLADTNTKYPIEIIGINNNSIDKTAQIFESIGLPTFFEEQKSCGYARRCGLQNAKGEYYICIDSDTMYPPDYIQMMVEVLEKKDVVAVSARWSFIPDKNHSWFSLKIYELIRDTHLYFQAFKRPELSVRGMTLGYKADLGRKVGYRVDIKRGEDGSMALGLKQYGKIEFIRSAKARVVTASNTLDGDGSIAQNLWKKMKTSLKHLPYFKKKNTYKDESSNLI